MDIRRLQPDEAAAADKLESLAFVAPVQADDGKENAYQADRWGCFGDDGQLRATLTNHDLPIWFDGKIASSRGVAGVASDPVTRGQGHVRELMRHVLRDDREAGALFSTLYPFSHPFYRRFGYETCFTYPVATFPTKALEVFQAGEPPVARLLLPEDGTAALHPVYQAFAQRYNLAVARDERTWLRRKLGNPFKAEQTCYVLSSGGRDTAYAMFYYRPQEKPFIRTLCITEYAFINAQAFAALMRFLHRFAAQAKDVELFVPDNLPLSSLLAEPYDIRRSTGSQPMARVLNVEGVLKAMRYPRKEGTFTLYVEDAFLPENEGCYRVAFSKNGGADVARCDGEADLRLTAQAFAQLALGFVGLTEAAYRPDVQIHGNASLLRRVFPKKPVFLQDFY